MRHGITGTVLNTPLGRLLPLHNCGIAEKFSLAKLNKLPEDLPPGIELELYKGRWALNIRGDLYVFPQHITKAEALKVVQMATIMKKGN